MKEITHKETRKVVVTDGYMSDDGIMFSTERECICHEKEMLIGKARAECTALEPRSLEDSYEIAESLYCSEYDTFYTFRPKSQEDITKMMAYIETSGSDFTVDDGKKEILLKDYFVFENEDERNLAFYSKDYVEKLYKSYIEQMFGEEE